MILELKTALAVREEPTGPKLTSPDEIECQLKDMRDLAQEIFVILTFNIKNILIKRHLISLGTVNSTLVHPREVFRSAILDGGLVQSVTVPNKNLQQQLGQALIMDCDTKGADLGTNLRPVGAVAKKPAPETSYAQRWWG